MFIPLSLDMMVDEDKVKAERLIHRFGKFGSNRDDGMDALTALTMFFEWATQRFPDGDLFNLSLNDLTIICVNSPMQFYMLLSEVGFIGKEPPQAFKDPLTGEYHHTLYNVDRIKGYMDSLKKMISERTGQPQEYLTHMECIFFINECLEKPQSMWDEIWAQRPDKYSGDLKGKKHAKERLYIRDYDGKWIEQDTPFGETEVKLYPIPPDIINVPVIPDDDVIKAEAEDARKYGRKLIAMKGISKKDYLAQVQAGTWNPALEGTVQPGICNM